MFASQLLRILHTIPSDMKYENCVYDPAEQNMTMKENQNVTFYGSKSFGKEAEPLAFGNQEICLLNDSRTGSVPLAFEVNGRNEHWNAKFVNDYSKDNESSTGDSPKKKDQNGHSYHLSGQDADSDSLSSGKDEANLWRSPDFECSTLVKEPSHCIGDEFQESGPSSISASDLIELDSNFSTDKNTLGFELPELIVCYKETDYHVVKDIHGGERMPTEESISIKNFNGNQSFLSSSQSPADGGHCMTTEGGVGMECFISDGLTASSLDNTTGIGCSEYGSKEEINGKLLAQGIFKSPLESTLVNDTVMDCDPTNLTRTVEAKSGVTGKIENDSSKEESLVASTLPIQEFGTRSFLRSFLNSLDIDGNITVSSNEMPSGKAVHESSADAEPKDDVLAKNTLYNSKVESGSISFSFDSAVSVAAGSSSGITENQNQQSAESGGLHNHKNANADNLSDTRKVQSNSTKENKTENFHEQPLNISSKFSVPSQVQCGSSKDGCHENGCEQSPDQNDGTFDDLSTDDQVQFASSKSQGSTNPNGQVEPFFPKHERGSSSSNISVVSQMQYDGESSFSAAGLVTYSGSIAYSGSLSLRSDGSTTSTRSFAFPVLQSEWNRSPVRMEKADRRHFQKHKGWRSGLFCCRF